MQINTQQFGGMWGQIPLQAQVLQALPGVTSPADYSALVKSKLGIYVVEIINNEVISAGTSTKESNATVLIHCWVNPGGPCRFTIKASSQTVLNDL